MRIRVMLLLLIVGLAAACGGDAAPPDTAAAPSATTSAPSSTTTTPATTVPRIAPSSTTTTTLRPAATSTTVPAAEPRVVLRHDGLGVVSFGEPVEAVMAVLTELLGPPDWEEVQAAPDIDRSVQWDDPFLYLQFTYWDHFDAAPEPPEPMPAGPVFHYYLTQSSEFATETGLRVESTVTDLHASYPDVRFENSCSDEDQEFVLDPPDGWLQLPMWGLLDGDPGDPDTRIVYLGAGWDRTPC